MKRRPDTELNADNYDSWMNEQENSTPNEPGGMKTADDNVLKKRSIIKARRRGATGAINAGFGNAFASVGTKAKENEKQDKPKSNPFSFLGGETKSKKQEESSTIISEKPSREQIEKMEENAKNSDNPQKEERFTRAVSTLNERFVKSVIDFIKSNRCVDLKPCFASYNKHFQKILEVYGTESVILMVHNSGHRDLTELCKKMNIESVGGTPRKKDQVVKRRKNEEEKHKESNEEEQKESTKPTPKIIPSLNPVKAHETKETAEKTGFTGFSFGTSQEKKSEEAPKKSGFSGFSFGASQEKNSEDSSVKTPFSFSFSANPQNNDNSTSEKPKPFTFGGAATSTSTSSPFTFSSKPNNSDEPSSTSKSAAPAENNSRPIEGEPSDAVPVVEEKKFETDNVVMELRAKLYYKAEEEGYKERGVGTIYIKEDPDNPEKGQILVRADNTLGTVLLNTAIYPNMPVQKQGKSNILIMCQVCPEIPKHSELTGKMNSFLIKVKGEDNAVEMERVIKKYV